jgi:hypothetical protein
MDCRPTLADRRINRRQVAQESIWLIDHDAGHKHRAIRPHALEGNEPRPTNSWAMQASTQQSSLKTPHLRPQRHTGRHQRRFPTVGRIAHARFEHPRTHQQKTIVQAMDERASLVAANHPAAQAGIEPPQKPANCFVKAMAWKLGRRHGRRDHARLNRRPEQRSNSTTATGLTRSKPRLDLANQPWRLREPVPQR